MKNLLALSILILAVGVFCTKAEKPSQQEKIVQDSGVAVAPERVFIELDIAELASSKTGDEISISLADGSSYSLLIQRKEEVMPGITNISAFVNDRETGQAVLVFRDDKLAGSVNMYSEGKSYKLGYDEESEQHFLVLVDPTKKDALPGGEPLEVPRKEQ